MAQHPALEPPSNQKGPTRAQILKHLRRAHEIAIRSVAMGHHPFGAVLVGPDQETVLLEQGNLSTVNHAEAVLARTADLNFTPDYLWDCTLYTTVEPCAMCAATQYWANIGRLVYGMDERRLLALTGASAENPTMDVPARYIYAHSQKAIEVIGPVPEVEEEIAELHRRFWSRLPAP
jgi:tRNA(Arg) A34 adenosine deaminase TadA